ncbi:N-6 DNA methylase [Siccirubricoccus phaeus]|uniref:N-6 DNA methylase n=1 Tax=Siccirubricoccus phaeus TaxID=2595053 RepID=UPI001F2A60D2|nr:N-6 DNA methylase [Siccirubricoccus phaeus]
MPDALWRGASALTVYFKYWEAQPAEAAVEEWRREIWNEGFAPLLWVISPQRIELYNGFGRPVSRDDAGRHLLRTFTTIERELQELDQLAGRLAMETGQFWLRPEAVNRKTSVDEQLLSDLAVLERDLVRADLNRATAQGLIGRSIFTQYLIDRKIVGPDRLTAECGVSSLPSALRDPVASGRLFTWLANVFNGDMFPESAATANLSERHLSRVADFLEAIDPETRQLTFFPYQFDVIPVELISSIYEQFAHSKTGAASADGDAADEDAGLADEAVAAHAITPAEAKRRGVHYTRLPVVSLILDEIMDGITGAETVLDLTCGSGVFLVEAFRRLVARKGGDAPARELIRSTLYNQVYGVDISDAAVRVAAFSLYLAALELDPDPQPPEGLKFERLIGRTLLVGDAHDVETTPEGTALLDEEGERRRFDIVVGNPPWTFRGKQGTQERRHRSRPDAPRQPRGEGLDFVLRATEFGHDGTRYGLVLSAMPFFAGSKTGAAAARYIVQRLSPATLVNLASHTKWLFPTAKMPAVVLLARHRPQSPDQLTVVNVPWSPSAEKSYTFEIAPSDITVLSLADWARDPERLKTAAFGRGRDMLLLDDLRSRFDDLNSWLTSIGSGWRDGLILGKSKQWTRDASHLEGLEVLGTKDLTPFQVPSGLTIFKHAKAQWPRARETYGKPILLIKEFLKAGPRPVAAVADRDLVYTDAYFGASVGEAHRESAHLIAAVLNSALASWFFLMTASEFGVWKRRLLTNDVGLLPLPDPAAAGRTKAGQRILTLEAGFRTRAVDQEGWAELDRAVFDLYGLDASDRLVVADGLTRASWQWAEGREYATQSAQLKQDLWPYAEAFISGVDAWLQATKKRRMRAEILDVADGAPLRVIRFLLEARQGPPTVEVIPVEGELTDVLDRIGRRLDVRLGSALVGGRELRVHGPNEIVVIKPAARRFWMPAAALEDADAVVAESFAGAAA